jgi:hypothetical protein
MSKKIKSYDELLEERARLEELLKTQKVSVQSNFIVLKDTLRPIGNATSNVVSVLGMIGAKKKTSPLVNLGLDFGTEIFLKRMVLARQGWFVRVFIPFIIRNYSSHLISEKKKPDFLKTIQKFFSKAKEKAEDKVDKAKDKFD